MSKKKLSFSNSSRCLFYTCNFIDDNDSIYSDSENDYQTDSEFELELDRNFIKCYYDPKIENTAPKKKDIITIINKIEKNPKYTTSYEESEEIEKKSKEINKKEKLLKRVINYISNFVSNQK
jgi:hypothetical protein